LKVAARATPSMGTLHLLLSSQLFFSMPFKVSSERERWR